MFETFSQLIHAQFNAISTGKLFQVAVTGDQLWDAYLASFPEGTNPMFRERTEHDCSCCRNFIKNLGPLIAIIDGEVHTVWQAQGIPAPYDTVAAALDQLVRQAAIADLYMTREPRYGIESNVEMRADGTTHRWHHLHAQVPKHLQSKTPGQAIGEYASSVQVLRRGLTELSTDAFATVLDLIESKSLYRGEEHLSSLRAFSGAQTAYQQLSPKDQELMVWLNADAHWARFRNTVIGTLVQDLSEGVDLEKAVASFESKVAPTNYKRPSALITPRMVESAMKTIASLDLEPALERRHASLSDVSVNNVLWVDNSVRSQMKDGIAGLLMEEAVRPAKIDTDKAEDISAEDFLVNVLPRVKSISVLIKNAMASNMMSITAPVHADIEPLFKWGNNFAWSYNGNIADSAIRKAVQERGGSVSGVFRFSHSWNYDKRNSSLMDLHVFMPANEIKAGNPVDDKYGNNQRVGWNHRNHTASGGTQDVDYVAEAPPGYTPVENITFPDLARMPEGTYVCKIHNWKLRQPTQGGFRAEIEFAGQVFQYEHTAPLANKEWVTVAEVTLKNGQFSIKHHLAPSCASQELWGIQTETFVKVNTLMFSPNHWDDQAVGNKHLFFLLDGCRNPEPTRGIYNEFLRSDLEQHRKVFEVLGGKTKCPVADDQLSGIGFSSTRGDSVVVQVTGQKLHKLYSIQF